MKNIEPQPPFKEPEFIQKWEEWMQYRKERKLPKYVPSGLTKTWANLYNISSGDISIACAIIDQSISQNWQGLFQLKNNGTIARNIKQNEPTGASDARISALKNLGRRKAS